MKGTQDPFLAIRRCNIRRELANFPLLGDAVIVLGRLYMPAARAARIPQEPVGIFYHLTASS